MNAQAPIQPSIVSALAAALPELESAKKNKANPAFKSKYADLAAVIEALEPIRKHGLWYLQRAIENADGAQIETIYIHTSGETLSAGTTFMPATKKDAQGFGSALSYCRRYGLQTAFGLATEDDDGNAAVKASQARQSEAPTKISDAQWSALVQLVEVTGTDAGKLCQAYSADSLKDFTAEQFNQAKAILEKRLKEKVKADA